MRVLSPPTCWPGPVTLFSWASFSSCVILAESPSLPLREELSGLTAKLPGRPRSQSLVHGKHPINDSRLRKMRKRVHYSAWHSKTPLLGATHTPSGEQEGLDRGTVTLSVKVAQCTSFLPPPGKKWQGLNPREEQSGDDRENYKLYHLVISGDGMGVGGWENLPWGMDDFK